MKISNLIIFKINKDAKNKLAITIRIGNEELQQKDSAIYLGVFFDKRFAWDKHNNK